MCLLERQLDALPPATYCFYCCQHFIQSSSTWWSKWASWSITQRELLAAVGFNLHFILTFLSAFYISLTNVNFLYFLKSSCALLVWTPGELLEIHFLDSIVNERKFQKKQSIFPTYFWLYQSELGFTLNCVCTLWSSWDWLVGCVPVKEPSWPLVTGALPSSPPNYGGMARTHLDFIHISLAGKVAPGKRITRGTGCRALAYSSFSKTSSISQCMGTKADQRDTLKQRVR